MKNIKLLGSILLTLLFLQSCSTSNSVVSNRMLQKRKFNKGWHINRTAKDYLKSSEESKRTRPRREQEAQIAEHTSNVQSNIQKKQFVFPITNKFIGSKLQFKEEKSLPQQRKTITSEHARSDKDVLLEAILDTTLPTDKTEPISKEKKVKNTLGILSYVLFFLVIPIIVLGVIFDKWILFFIIAGVLLISSVALAIRSILRLNDETFQSTTGRVALFVELIIISAAAGIGGFIAWVGSSLGS